MDDITVHQIHAGDGDGAEIIFNFNNQRLAVSIFPDHQHGENRTAPAISRVIHLLERSTSADIDDDDDQYEEVVDEALEIILHAGRPLFKEASTKAGNHQHHDLHATLYPNIVHFQFAGDGQSAACIISLDPKQAYVDLPGKSMSNDSRLCASTWSSNLPCYSTREVLIDETLVEGAGHFAGRVSVDHVHVQMFCKADGCSGLSAEIGVGRELECLQRLVKDGQSTHADKVRIPKLLGLIEHAETGSLVGFVRQWVPGRLLRDVDFLSASSERKTKWVRQISETVWYLHAIQLVWGDGKPGNVIVDELDDAWLIDFGGGFTNGWVDEHLSNTTKGDEQAISRIQTFLGLHED